jgi:hypothetical protein
MDAVHIPDECIPSLEEFDTVHVQPSSMRLEQDEPIDRGDILEALTLAFERKKITLTGLGRRPKCIDEDTYEQWNRENERTLREIRSTHTFRNQEFLPTCAVCMHRTTRHDGL